MWATLRQHWAEYMMEAAELGIFMLAACAFGTLLEHPASPVQQALGSPVLRRMLMGVAMGVTAIGIIYSPWGQQSGAHLNPALTVTFLRLGKVAPWDAVFYIMAQFTGGLLGVLIASVCLGPLLAAPTVNYVVTIPGIGGPGIAFLMEIGLTFLLMSMVLMATNTPRLARYTGVFAGSLVALYIPLAAPLSGMSLNPARTFGSALPAQVWTSVWIYFAAPVLGMLLAAELYRQRYGLQRVICAKLQHHTTTRCIFRGCGYKQDHDN